MPREHMQGRNRDRFHPLASYRSPSPQRRPVHPAALVGLVLALIGAVLIAFALLIVARGR